MYREHIMDHYKHPRQKGTLENPDVSWHEKNPSCGDEITIQTHITDTVITDIMFSGQGCAISIAATSMLLEELKGKTIEEVLAMKKEEMLEVIGIPLTTMRVKCGLLGLHTVKKALYKYLGTKGNGEW